MNILKYLRSTRGYVLTYSKNQLVLLGYMDANFQSDPDDYASTSSYVFMLAEGAVSQHNIKQKGTTASTTKAEYVIVSETSKEAVWYRRFPLQLGVVLAFEPPLMLHCSDAVAQSKDSRDHSEMRHVNRKYHIIRQFQSDKEIVMRKS